MFNPKRNKKEDNKYTRFDDRILNTYKNARDEIKRVQRELEEEEKKDREKRNALKENRQNSTISPKNTNSTTMDNRTHEGRVNKRGSIEGGEPISALGHTMGEGASLEYRRKIIEDKNRKKIAKKERDIDNMKKKRVLRKAIIYSEILGAPLSKRK